MSHARKTAFASTIFAASWLFLLLLVTTSSADAYIDPGTGSLLLQTIVGALAVAGAVATGFRNRIRALGARWLSAAALHRTDAATGSPDARANEQ